MVGTVEVLNDTYGFIRGEDSVSRFFLPSAMQATPGVTFEQLQVGDQVSFAHIDHPRGPRAIEIRVIKRMAEINGIKRNYEPVDELGD